MEEILCIGCGATIQTTDKAGLGFTPSRHLKKVWRLAKSIANAVSVSATTMKSQMSSWRTMISSSSCTRWGDSDALVVNVIDIFDFNGSVIPGLPRFVSGNDVLLVGNKKISSLSQLSLVRLASGSWNVPMKKVFVQSMWS